MKTSMIVVALQLIHPLFSLLSPKSQRRKSVMK